MNDVLDLHAMTNGEFKLKPARVQLSSAMLDTLRRCRAYLSDDVKFQYSLPRADLEIYADMFRVSQILSNALRYAKLNSVQAECDCILRRAPSFASVYALQQRWEVCEQ